MNRKYALAFRLAGVAFAAAVVCSSWGVLQRETPAAPAAQAAPEEEDPFTPLPAVPLPPGMTGSTTNDPRVGLKPGLYDAGEAAMGMEHIAFLKNPPAFQLPSSTQADDPVVQKTLGMLGINNISKMPKPLQLVIAQLAFANSDFAFQGTHLFQGNFYGINIYDISNPANATLVTSLVCPGGQGDVSVYKN